MLHPSAQYHLRATMQGYDPINKQYSREQHRLADFFTRIQDRFWPFNEWPGWLQDVALTSNKDYGQRTKMFYFLVRNNLYGPMARDWTLACDYVGGKLVPHEYSQDVRIDMAVLVKKALNGQVAAAADTPTMNMAEGKVTFGLNPAHYPSWEQLRALRTRVKLAELHEAPGPAPRAGPKPRQGVYYPPQFRKKGKLASGVRFIPGSGLTFRDLDGRWRAFKSH